MSTEKQNHDNQNNENFSQEDVVVVKKELSDVAKRALAEAEERRKLADEKREEIAKEFGGRGGADPSRFGDWEIDGRAIDF
ncbi:MAG: DUF1674 domain-containing protein [Lentilitoribacter sp.]